MSHSTFKHALFVCHSPIFKHTPLVCHIPCLSILCFYVSHSILNIHCLRVTFHFNHTLPVCHIQFLNIHCLCATLHVKMYTVLQELSVLVAQVRRVRPKHGRSWACCCLLFFGCWTFQQHASVPQGRICCDNFTCCHTEIEVADQTTSPSHSIQTSGQPVTALSL